MLRWVSCSRLAQIWVSRTFCMAVVSTPISPPSAPAISPAHRVPRARAGKPALWRTAETPSAVLPAGIRRSPCAGSHPEPAEYPSPADNRRRNAEHERPDSSPFLIRAVVATFAGKQDGDAHELNSDPSFLPLGIRPLVQCFDLQFIPVLDVIDNRVGSRRDIAGLNRIDQSDMVAE